MANDRATPAFGDLNPVEDPEIGRSLDLRNTSAINAIREAARNVFKKDAFANTGPLKAIVLRVEEPSSDQHANSWSSNVFGEIRTLPLKAVRARIPEIHATLPEPASYGPNAGESNKIIDLYPLFISVNQDISNQPVAPGDIILVDFANRENLTHPQYLGPIFQGTLAGVACQQTAESTVNQDRGSSLGMTPPTGDPIGSGVKNPEKQMPETANPPQNDSNINNASLMTNTSDVAEANHLRVEEPTSTGIPSMREREEAFSRGRSQGIIELVELPFPEQATKEGVFISKEHLGSWTEMHRAAKKDGIRLRLNSGFRSNPQQKYLYDNYRAGTPGFNLAARPGHSNHQSGIAFDIAGTKGGRSRIYIWLAKNAHKFGFINTGRFFRRQSESWHWEFLGINNQRVVREGNVSVRTKQRSLIA